MKNEEIINLFTGLSFIKGLKGVAFNYAISKNINKLKSEVEAIESTLNQSDSYKEYEAKRIELCEKHSKKGPDGKSLFLENGSYSIEDQALFDKDFKKLQQESKETLDERTKQLEDFKELLKKETSIELYKIKLEVIPEEITTEQMNAILPMIEQE